MLDPSWVIVGATDCLALVGLAVTLDAGAAKVHETAVSVLCWGRYPVL